ncbi:hypothetical protein [Allonocardiopsis opalescens]|uniref:Uncharacterized protein n=1 Tax=Allonocardiopsis opalescens TaxID=1144618 RepID=A0A2T0PW66_9ACTN|nr:hypothetical protein [Allonocardiopsis opalescens]PRX95598.1 hypothetical protein CLV72_109207 [Allonocardiopsis opalescens]
MTLYTTPAEPRLCVRCDTWVLRAHADGVDIRVDPVPLDAAAEEQAVAEGRSTYDAVFLTWPARTYLEYRDEHRRARPRDGPVLRAHRCPRTSPPTLF